MEPHSNLGSLRCSTVSSMSLFLNGEIKGEHQSSQKHRLGEQEHITVIKLPSSLDARNMEFSAVWKGKLLFADAVLGKTP